MAKSGVPTPPLPTKFDPTPSQIEQPSQTTSLALTQIQGLTLNPTPPIIRSEAYKSFIDYMPNEMHRFVEDIVNVRGDGNCGFRCFARLLGRGEDDFWSVRNELFEELQRNIDLYTTLFEGGISRVHHIMKALKKQHREVEGNENWMTFPECAYLAANKYKATIVSWYRVFPFSVYPFLIAPIKTAPVFHILFTGNHFVTPVMKRGSPMPGTITPWTNNRKQIAKDWPRQYTGPLQQYKALNPYSHAPQTVDLSKD